MQYKHNKNLVSNAKQLRKEMTKEERRLRRATGFCVAKAWGIDNPSVTAYAVPPPFHKGGFIFILISSQNPNL